MSNRRNLALFIFIGIFGGVMFQYSPPQIYAQNPKPLRIQVQTPGENNGVGGGVFRVGDGVSAALMFQKVEVERFWKNVGITGKSIERKPDGSFKIVGNAVVETKLLTISAEEMVYNQDTGEIEPRGNVRVKLKSEPK